LEKENLAKKILKELNLKSKKTPNWNKWKKLVNKIKHPSKRVKVVIVGKYVDIGDYNLADSYVSINHSLTHAGAALNVGVDIEWVDSKLFENARKSKISGTNSVGSKDKVNILKKFDGIIVPGGFGASGVEGKIKAINFARIHKLPYLGLCYGLQLAVVEYARNVCKMKNANTSENKVSTKFPVIDILPTQKKLMEKSDYGGTMRLGAYAAVLKEKSKVLQLYKETGRLKEDAKKVAKLKKAKDQAFRLGMLNNNKNIVLERHRHRFEVNPKFINRIESKGLVYSGYHLRKDGTKLMEFIELPNHPYFIATQAHPEFKSRLGNPNPLFYGFVRACAKK